MTPVQNIVWWVMASVLVVIVVVGFLRFVIW